MKKKKKKKNRRTSEAILFLLCHLDITGEKGVYPNNDKVFDFPYIKSFDESLVSLVDFWDFKIDLYWKEGFINEKPLIF